MILFVDDEPRHMSPYVRQLTEAGLQVSFKDTVDEALEYIEGNPSAVSLLVLDIMMPPGRSFDSAQTRYGLDTGIRFYERVRRHSPALPVIILTNVTDERVARRFRAEPNCQFVRKLETEPYQLVEIIKETLEFPLLG